MVMAIIRRETDYAVRVLGRLAAERDFVPASVLSREEGVPILFARKILQRLQGAGLLVSRRGPQGGYRLGVEPGEVTIGRIAREVQGPVVMNECFARPETCSRVPDCRLRVRLGRLGSVIERELDSITLRDIVGRKAGPAGA